MQFGMFFELQSPRPWTDGSDRKIVRDALESAEVGERCGIDYAWAQEHHFLEEYAHSTAPEVFLAAVSQRTEKMRLGHGVTLMPSTYNHPARVAERIAMLDLVSDGRVEWGTGESNSRIELEGFRVPYVGKRAMWAEGVREAAKMMCSEPYPGFEGRSFSMPVRNVVPKPVQKPHPPIWVACTNRDTLKLAARLGIGALTFSFMDGGEARYWVQEYYETFERECVPLGQAVNPNVAMLAGVMCHRDSATAVARGLEAQQFFKYALAHYYRFGAHVPGRTNLWEEFQRAEREPMAGVEAVGDPDEVRLHFRELEDAGVDQVILLQQGGKAEHEHICESLELLGAEVFPEFRARHAERIARKTEMLTRATERALARVVPPDAVEPPLVESYPRLWKKEVAAEDTVGTKRAFDATSLWRLHVGGAKTAAPAAVADSLVALVRRQADRSPDDVAFGFVPSGDGEPSTLSRAGLETEARRIASLLAGRIAPGARALLVFEPGLDFLAAFFGALFAGVIAVPVFPPLPPRFAGFDHLERVQRDAGAEAILTSSALSELADSVPGGRERLRNVRWIVTDRDGDAEAWRDPGVTSSTIAFLQYTSGSTSEPRGVVLRHEHLLANLRALDWFVGAAPGPMVSWLPMYHDMGLIGTVLYPLSRERPAYLLSPFHFLQRPARWLELVTRVRGAISGAPNFAYELCVRRVGEADRARLDLASWEITWNGAEPIRSATARRFEDAFAPCGLRRGSVAGCYGLAEATLFVAGVHRGDPGEVEIVDRDELEHGRAVPALDGARRVELASCGKAPPEHELRIVDPETCTELPERHVGEIWLRGPSVAGGYWQRPDETAATFGASLAGDASAARYLRTGDLGFAHDGRLYVTGRLKDLLIVRGRNIHPQDVEDAAQRADARLRPGRGVAFPVATDDGERIGLVQETAVQHPAELEHLARAVRETVFDQLQVGVETVVFVPPHSVRRTSSGKLQRRATRRALDAGELNVLYADGGAEQRPQLVGT
jgi:acyl-CoA synthetase (AMP-forming)/AMP-acid ligase II/alkanesulfonate monooxygenase SsuD/methylene tetrahydromethanopterin reductase-like flavin-dependent oxidoreductase (luciferase family)